MSHNQHLLAGQEARFECIVYGSRPRPSITWQLLDQPPLLLLDQQQHQQDQLNGGLQLQLDDSESDSLLINDAPVAASAIVSLAAATAAVSSPSSSSLLHASALTPSQKQQQQQPQKHNTKMATAAALASSSTSPSASSASSALSANTLIMQADQPQAHLLQGFESASEQAAAAIGGAGEDGQSAFLSAVRSTVSKVIDDQENVFSSEISFAPHWTQHQRLLTCRAENIRLSQKRRRKPIMAPSLIEDADGIIAAGNGDNILIRQLPLNVECKQAIFELFKPIFKFKPEIDYSYSLNTATLSLSPFLSLPLSHALRQA